MWTPWSPINLVWRILCERPRLTLGTDARVGVEHLDQQHLFRTLFAKVIPSLPIPMVRIEIGAFELSPNVVAFDQIVIED